MWGCQFQASRAGLDLDTRYRYRYTGRMPLPQFDFPPLGNTGEGEPPFPEAKYGDAYWMPEPFKGYWVMHQADRPACALRCNYPGGGSPCDQATAGRFIEWAKAQ